MIQEIYIAALDWLGRGFDLLPIQPGTKKKAVGFGVYSSRITDQYFAAQYFRDASMRWNLGVVAPEGTIILDFDNWDTYLDWVRFAKRFDDSMTTSYTEVTPRYGAHVFLSGEVPDGLKCRDGVEVKRDIVVAPSIVGGVRYEPLGVETHIYHGSLDAVFFFLSRPCPDSAVQVVSKIRDQVSHDGGAISRIKGALSIVELMRKYYPRIKLKQRGVFYNSLCPFHAEKNPSFWLNAQLNIFGCHACKARGDVINFYALAKNINNDQAVRELMTFYA